MPKNHINIPIFIPHQGCPHKCIFCNQWATVSEQLIPDTNFIYEKVSKYLSSKPPTVKTTEIAFFGGSFTGIDKYRQEELLSAAYKFLMEQSVDGLRLSTRPDMIDEDRLTLLKKYDVSTIELGIQSFDDKILKFSNRGYTSEDIYNAIQLIKKFKFDFVIQLMPGLPGDSMKSSIKSAETTAMLKPSAVRIYPAIVLRNTELEKIFKNGKYTPLSIDDAVETCAEMYKIFKKSRIQVIRLGLHPLSRGNLNNIIAGPYHSAFGFMVKSRVKRIETEKRINDAIKEKDISIDRGVNLIFPDNCKEEYIGYNKNNITYLKKIFDLIDLKYKIADIPHLLIENY